MVDFTGFEKAKVCGGCHRCLTTEEHCETCARIVELEAALAEAREDSARLDNIVRLWEAYLALDGDFADDVRLMLAFGKAADATKAARGRP